MRRLGAVLLLGSLLAALIALTHLAGSVQLFGAEGVTLPSWVVLLAAPITAVAGIALLERGAQRNQARARRRRTPNAELD